MEEMDREELYKVGTWICGLNILASSN
jgi:hypothetical protein